MYENEDQQEDSVSIVSSWMLQKQKVLQGEKVEDRTNCSSFDIDSFPSDGFTQKQRRHGALIFHFIVVHNHAIQDFCASDIFPILLS
jgi:hypothetical protein